MAFEGEDTKAYLGNKEKLADALKCNGSKF
jgi:hypothetical protein